MSVEIQYAVRYADGRLEAMDDQDDAQSQMDYLADKKGEAEIVARLVTYGDWNAI